MPSGLDPERLFSVVQQLRRRRAARTTVVVTDVDDVRSDGLELEHLVERRRAENLGRRDVE